VVSPQYDVQQQLESLSKAQLIRIVRDDAKNWLAHDGLWFQAIDPRIQTRCVACPPDPRGQEHEGIWCAWEFTLAPAASPAGPPTASTGTRP
jgi:hypothetical protein